MRLKRLAMALVLGAAPFSALTTAEAGVAATLKPGRPVFWSDNSARATIPDAPACTTCDDYAIDVAPGGVRLRVAVDSPETAVIAVYRGSNRLGSTSGPMSAELLISPAPPGRYYVRMERT